MKKRRYAVFLLLLLVLFVTSNVSVKADGTAASSNHTELAKTIAEEGTVLLKNDYNTLPLKKNEKVAGLGVAQDVAQVFGGGGSGWVNSRENVNYATGLQNAAKEGLIKSYTPIGNPSPSEAYHKLIYFINRNTTEGNDLTESDFYLNNVEKNDIKTLIDNFGKERVIVVLNVGTVMDTSWLINQDVGAIVLAYLGGEQAGNALANVLTGKVNPSGRLVDTWAKSYDYYPSSTNSGIGTFGADKNTYYTEDIYVGYRYFATFDPQYEKVNYEFGYGLSYTSFELSNYKVVLNDDVFKVSVDVKNTGLSSGKEVVQLYFDSPKGELGAASAELVGFVKTDLLKPNQTQTVVIEFSREEFAKYDDLGKIAINSWVLEKGDYNLYVGNSIKSAMSNESIYTYKCTKNIILETTSALKNTTSPKRLLSDGSYETLTNSGEMVKINTISKCGSVVIQAEDYASMSGTGTSEIYYVGTNSAFGLGNINKPNNVLEYKLHVLEAGKYSIGFNMASAWDNQTNMFNLYVNNVKQNINVSMNATHTDSDNKWYTTTYLNNNYQIDLPQGDVTLRFESNGTNFMNFDSFVIYNNLVSKDDSTIIQAENFYSSTLKTEQIADGSATYRSNKANNEYIYKLKVEEAGVYYLNFNMSNVVKATEDAMAIYVNNSLVDVKVELMRTAVNGDVLDSNYHTFVTTKGVGVYLPSGDVTLKFVTKNDSVSCIDLFTLTPENIYDFEDILFSDNTNEFEYQSNTQGEVLDSIITYNDVCLDNNKIDAFLSQLSIQELIYLTGLDIEQTTLPTGVGGVGGMNVSSKYGIPSAYCADGPAGIRYTDSNKYATWFPCMTLLASTWNVELAQEFGNAIGEEALAGNVDVWLAPGVNIHRNPLCGRNFEYFSEDPLLSGLFGAYITNGVQSMGVSVCVKHYVGNEQETNRFGMNSCISNRALREIYLKPFEIVIEEANPYSIMSSYNMVNGVHVASSSDMIIDVLRTDFGFEGAVFSDWWPHMSHISMIQSGNTYKSASPEYDSLLEAYHSGVLTREDFESIAKVSIEFIMKTTANKQNTIKINTNNTNVLNKNDRTFEGDTDNGYAYIYRLSIDLMDEYILTFTNLNDNVKVTINNNEVEIKNGTIQLLLDSGINELRIDSLTKNQLDSLNISVEINHSYGDWITIKSPTCKSEGEEYRICIYHDTHIETKKIDKLPHQYENYISNNDATCQHDGTKTAICSNGCGSIDIIVDENTKLEHNWDSGTVLEGKKEYKCLECGETKVEILNKEENGCSGSIITSLGLINLLAFAVVLYKRKNDVS